MKPRAELLAFPLNRIQLQVKEPVPPAIAPRLLIRRAREVRDADRYLLRRRKARLVPCQVAVTLPSSRVRLQIEDES